MNHIKFGILTAAAAFIGLSTAQAETLAGAIQKALENSPESRSAELGALAAELGATEAEREAKLPRATLSGSTGTGFRDRSVEGIASDGDWLAARELRMTITQPLFDGGSRWEKVKAAQARAEAGQLNRQEEREAIALEVIEAYFGVLRSQELIRVARANLKNHEEVQGKLGDVAAAEGDNVDAALVAGRVGLAKSILTSREVELRQAALRYQHFVGEPPTGLTVPKFASNVPKSEAEIDASGNPSRKIAELNAEAFAADAEAERRGHKLPRIDLQVRGGIGEDVQGISGEDNEFAALLVASWDVFNPAKGAAVERLEALAAKGEADAEVAELQATELAGSAFADLSGGRDQVEVLSTYVKELDTVVEKYDDQFSVGRRSLLNVLDVRQEQFRAQSALVDASLLQRLSEYRLLSAQGQLLEQFEAGGE
ncbi:MAG: TolC family protein [Verrucomicrobiota bacterium]